MRIVLFAVWLAAFGSVCLAMHFAVVETQRAVDPLIQALEMVRQ